MLHIQQISSCPRGLHGSQRPLLLILSGGRLAPLIEHLAKQSGGRALPDFLVTPRTVERIASIFLSGTQEEGKQQKEKKNGVSL